MRNLLGDRKLYRVRVEGEDIASVIGALDNDEIAALTERCRLAGAHLVIEELDIPVGLEAVLDEQDFNRAQDIRSILERREKV